MAVQNIECQIALGQMGRFLSGDALAADVEAELKAHIAQCAACAAALERRQALLQAMLAAEAPEGDPQSRRGGKAGAMPQNERAVARRSKNLFAAAVVESPGEPTRSGRESPRIEPLARNAAFWKPLVYSAALAIVMILMSFVMRDPTRLFGERAASDPIIAPAATHATKDAASPATPPDRTAIAPVPSDEGRELNPNPPSPPAGVDREGRASAVAPVEPPQADLAAPAKSKPKAPQPTAAAKPQRAQTLPTGTLRVYDADGNPIHP